MRKKLNNSGFTLVEVIAAAVILVIIAAPILNSLLQTVKMNASSGVDIKMKAEAERVIEEIKAANGSTNVNAPDYTPETPNKLDYSTTSLTKAYYDSLFNYVGIDASDPRDYYYLTADETTVNNIDTSDPYDRWDFKIGVKNYNDYDDSQIYVYNNKETMALSSFGGKLYDSEELTQGNIYYGKNLSLDFQGNVDNTDTPYRFNYLIDGTEGPSSGIEFMPGESRGKINSEENTIVVDLFRVDNVNSDPPPPILDVDVSNSTYYGGSLSIFNTTTVNGIKTFVYSKNIIVNVFGDNPTNPTIKVSPKSPYITVNYSQGSMPAIKNGYKINIKIYKVSNQTSPVKIVPSVVE